jgi:3-dehydro-L-gulonate 2-dehydrogenase
MASPDFIRVSHDEMLQTFQSILLRNGFTESKSNLLSEVFTTNSLEGVYTHGVNRFAKFIQFVKGGYVRPDSEATCIHQVGNLQQWNGNLGPGPINAIMCTDAAIRLAKENTIGCVSLANTNHWMRAGYYGWRAVKENVVFIAWTNTLGNMPAWGATDSRLGNNPLVIAVPYGDHAIVLDTAMSQYSYGSLDLYHLKGEKLPVTGGYTVEGELTDDPQAIINSRRPLPIGYWKGAGISLLLDILATVLSGGRSTSAVSKLPVEYGMSQVFIAIDLSKLSNASMIRQSIDQIIGDYHQSSPVDNGKKVRYPGERLAETRDENLKKGIPVSEKVWKEILDLSMS